MLIMLAIIEISLMLIFFWYYYAVAVDGAWSPWSTLGKKCSSVCGGGVELKVRSCTNPAPEGNGKKCEGDTQKLFPCNTHECQVGWTNWTECDGKCDKGVRRRRTLCGPKQVLCTAEANKNEYKEEVKNCTTWNKTACPSPCFNIQCPEFSLCKDNSTDMEPIFECKCVMNKALNSNGSLCIVKPPPAPTARPIPHLSPDQKTAAVIITKTASTVILIFLAITFGLFLLLRIFTPDRVIHMNMEIALGLAHIVLLFPPQTIQNEILCRVLSMLLHFLFTACFAFLMLEALHFYSLVAFVVKKDGILSRLQNTIVGWSIALFICIISISFQFRDYGATYHCWLELNRPLMYAVFIPVTILVIITLTLTEAAGSADYKALKGTDKKQLLSAKINQRSILIILPMTFASWFIGMLSEYEQNLPLYSIFSTLNGILGGVIFFFHCTANEQVRDKLANAYRSACVKNK